MNHYIMQINASQENEEFAWQMGLAERNAVLLRVRSLREAIQFCRAYQILLIIMEVADGGPETCEMLASLRASQNEGATRPPIIGLSPGRLEAEERAALAQAGLLDILSQDDPEEFILWHIEVLMALSELRRFEEARTGVADLASRTRSQLHDLSQPLSAVQGRLQLMAAQCPSTDPNAQTYKDLVRLIFDVTHRLMEIQQIHRQYS